MIFTFWEHRIQLRLKMSFSVFLGAVVHSMFSSDLCLLGVNRVRTTCGRMQWCSRFLACAPCCCSATRTLARGSSTSDDTRLHTLFNHFFHLILYLFLCYLIQRDLWIRTRLFCCILPLIFVSSTCNSHIFFKETIKAVQDKKHLYLHHLLLVYFIPGGAVLTA